MTPYLLTHYEVEYTPHCLTVYLPPHERELEIEVVALMPLVPPGNELVAPAGYSEPLYPSLELPENKQFVRFKVDCDPLEPQFYLMMMVSDEVIVSTTGRSVPGRSNPGAVRNAWLEQVKGNNTQAIFEQFKHLHWESAVIAVPVK